MLIDGILSIIYTAAAIGAAYAGKGDLILEFGGEAGQSLAQVIANSIKAGELMLYVYCHRDFIGSCSHKPSV
jgi:hypothetical protein